MGKVQAGHGLDIEAMATNIVDTYRTATAEQVAEGAEWYPVAHALCVGWAEEYDITLDQACGVLAAISPRLNWNLNVAYAERIFREGYAPILGGNLAKALAILATDADPLTILSGNKVRSFYSNILDLSSPAVTIDRHAIDVALGFVGDDKSRKVLDRKGGYDAVADAYRAAAEIVHEIPAVVQAITWVVQRERKN